MDPTGSPFRRPPPPPAFRARRSSSRPVRAAAPTASGRSRGVPRGSRARALGQGAGAIYLVAALTLVGAALSLASHDPGVVIGLGLTRWTAGVGPAGWVALALAAGFALLGLLAQRGRLWAFGVGAALYALDGLIVLAAHDWVAVTIHTVVLVMMVRGLEVGRRRA